MNYKLAKQLKDAGFAQGNGTGNCKIIITDHKDRDMVHYPTLSELIEVCSDDVFELMLKQTHINDETYWEAGYWEDIWEEGLGFDTFNYDTGTGKTPEEAVANFWLELNKKDE